MTIGELAGLFNAEKKLGADLTVVKLAGYSRDLWYDDEIGKVSADCKPESQAQTMILDWHLNH